MLPHMIPWSQVGADLFFSMEKTISSWLITTPALLSSICYTPQLVNKLLHT